MDNNDRARQFMPFAALNGYYDMIDDAAKIKQEKKELSEEKIAEIASVLSRIEKGMFVKINCYNTEDYQIVEGIVTKIDAVQQILQVVKRTIAFEDIEQIEIIEEF